MEKEDQGYFDIDQLKMTLWIVEQEVKNYQMELVDEMLIAVNWKKMVVVLKEWKTE